MSYCHKCGKVAGDVDDFCGYCGAKLREFIKETEVSVKKKRRRGLFIFIIFILVIIYVALDLWAMTQLRPVWSVDGILSSVSDTNVNSNLAQTDISSTFRLENPTFVPVFAGRVVYDADYGGTKFADGKTRLVMLAPYSQKDIPAEVTISHFGAGWSILKGIKNFFLGGNDKLNANAYVDIGITKFRIAGGGQ